MNGSLRIFFIAVASLVMAAVSRADTVRITSFQQAGDFTTSQPLQMDEGDNIVIVYYDLQQIVSIADAGYLEGSWHLGLFDSGGLPIGWATNSNKEISGQEGRLIGQYSHFLGGGNRPINSVLIYDKLNNGWEVGVGVLAIGSQIDLDQGDLFFWQNNLLLDGILGNMIGFDSYGQDEYARIAPIGVLMSPVPEPATIGLLGLGGLLLRKKK